LHDKIYCSRPNKIFKCIQKYISSIVSSDIVFDIKELLVNIKKLFGITISKSSIYNVLKNNNITFKKLRIRNFSENKNGEHIITNFKNTINQNIPKDKIISIDESHVCSHMNPLFGWCNKGDKLIVSDFKKLKSKRYSLLCAINNKKVIAYDLVEGSINAIKFNSFLEKYIYIEEFKDHHLLLDNARIHHAKIVKHNENKTIPFIYNIPYSPELNPIEKVFSIVKMVIRNNYFKNHFDLKGLIDLSIKKIHDGIMLDSFYKKCLGYS
jgi:transposase